MFNVKTSETFQLKSGVRKGYSLLMTLVNNSKYWREMGKGHEWAISFAIWDECMILEQAKILKHPP